MQMRSATGISPKIKTSLAKTSVKMKTGERQMARFPRKKPQIDPQTDDR